MGRSKAASLVDLRGTGSSCTWPPVRTAKTLKLSQGPLRGELGRLAKNGQEAYLWPAHPLPCVLLAVQKKPVCGLLTPCRVHS